MSVNNINSSDKAANTFGVVIRALQENQLDRCLVVSSERFLFVKRGQHFGNESKKDWSAVNEDNAVSYKLNADYEQMTKECLLKNLTVLKGLQKNILNLASRGNSPQMKRLAKRFDQTVVELQALNDVSQAKKGSGEKPPTLSS